ncbi:MAG: helix-turn-helix domain-containing protein [Acidobacteriota bacterium]|nr:helix-turn-helix domain-containing protein [Acidobacteriota bacterium]
MNAPTDPPIDPRAEWLSTPQAAEYCGLSPRTLEKYRLAGGGPSFYKLGGRVSYSLTDLDQWLEGCHVRTTSGPGRQSGGEPRAAPANGPAP